MRKKHYDIVVVGCGPSGSMAGKFAALSGAETIVLEEKRQIGFPVNDSMGIIYSKSEMEEIAGESIEPSIIYGSAGGLVYISPSGKQGKVQSMVDGIFLNRQLFEKSLAMAAARSGAEIMLHARVVDLSIQDGVVTGVMIKNGSQLTEIPCSLVIAADGCYHRMAYIAGIKLPRGRISASLGYEFVGVRSLHGSRNIAEIYLDDSGEGMYRYVVPYGGDRFSVACSVVRTANKQKRSLKQRLDEFLRHLETIGRYDFSNASPVSMMSGGTGVAAASRLAADGIVLVGNAAGAPLYGSRWGGIGLMLGACWTGRFVGNMAADAVRKGDVSGKSLNREYINILQENLGKEGRFRVMEAMDTWRQIITLGSEKQERAVEEIGKEIAALHFFSKGALPLQSSLQMVQNWLRTRKGDK